VYLYTIVLSYFSGPQGSWSVRICCLHLKMEFCSCARGRQWCGIIHYHWWTASIKPRLLFSRIGYASWGLSLSSVYYRIYFYHYTCIPAVSICKDLDPHGCALNPSLCQDPVLAVVTCPRTCNTCRELVYSLEGLLLTDLNTMHNYDDLADFKD